MLSYYVMHDVVNNLEEKFKEQFTSYDRMFFGANFIKMLDFYKLLSFFENPYELKSKIENEKQKDLLYLLVEHIKTNSYDQGLIFMAYGILINKTINEVCKPYFSSLCGIGSDLSIQKKKMKFQRIVSYHLRGLFTLKQQDYKQTPSTYKATEVEINAITDIFAKVYNLSNTKKIVETCCDNLEFYYNQNINFLCFKRWFYSFHDKFSKSKVSLRSSLRTKLYKKDVDYLNLENRAWLNPYTDKLDCSSFLDIYQDILSECNKKISKLNYWIFYNDKTSSIFRTKEFIVENSTLENPIFSKNTKFKKEKIKKSAIKEEIEDITNIEDSIEEKEIISNQD